MDLNLFPLQATHTAAKTARGTRKLIVVLHGRGDSPRGFEFLPDALALDDVEYLMLQAPDDYYDGYSWYDHPPNQLPGVLRSRNLLTETFDQLWRSGFSAGQTVLFGFSQGCLMTLEFGSRYPHRFAGYVGISGYALDPETIVREAVAANLAGPWLVTHGTADEVLPIKRTREQIRHLQAAGFTIDYREYSKTHTIEDRKEIPELREWIRKALR